MDYKVKVNTLFRNCKIFFNESLNGDRNGLNRNKGFVPF